MKDPDFLADACRRGLDIDPTTGQEVTALVHQLYDTPAEMVERGRDVFVHVQK